MLIYLFIAKIVYGMMNANKRILQEDFFVTLHSILTQKEEVTELQPVPDAHVPVLKFKFHGISIDLLYASLSLSVIPEVSVIVLNI
jgi:poly(A) polymerase Pap1